MENREERQETVIRHFYIDLSKDIGMKLAFDDTVFNVYPACEYADDFELENGKVVRVTAEIPKAYLDGQ